MKRLRKAEYERARLLLEGEAISRGELLRREADGRRRFRLRHMGQPVNGLIPQRLIGPGFGKPAQQVRKRRMLEGRVRAGNVLGGLAAGSVSGKIGHGR